jgi:hypothetical protein
MQISFALTTTQIARAREVLAHCLAEDARGNRTTELDINQLPALARVTDMCAEPSLPGA